VEPFKEFFSRQGVKQAALILIFILLYKLGDSMATALATPFYLDMGFTKTEIGLVAKNAALWPMIIGGILGGILMLKIGINRALWLFGLVQIISILGFAVLARVGEGIALLALVISFEYLGVGLGTAAFVAFIARTTHPAFAATQFALFTALTAVPRTVASSATGIIVEGVGWENFFYLCTLLAIPGMLLLLKVAPWNGNEPELTSK
jgi:PAT family beta-lactamase induction signal transducer AmpG